MGVGSTLKSPVWMMTPSGVVMASATALTMEWVTWMNSILNGPISTICFGLIGMKTRLFLEFVFLHAAFHQRQGERRAVDRDIDIAEEIRDRADVVLMAVGEDQGAHVLLVFLEDR